MFPLLLPILFLPILLAGCASTANGQSILRELKVDGNVRSYLVYKPLLHGTEKSPLMIVLHGGLGNAERIEEKSSMNTVADMGKFIVAYPNGSSGRFRVMNNMLTWNAGHCCGQAQEKNVNDVLFIKKMIDEITSKYAIDTHRIYVTGLSNGAMMAYRLACEIPDKIAAIMPVSGTMAVDSCDAAKDIPVFHIHGDQDRNVPVAGGKGEKGLSDVSHRSVSDTVQLLIRARGCTTPEIKNLNDGDQITSYRCNTGAPVDVLIIKGGGHAWPWTDSPSNKSSGDRQIEASKLIWDFAKKFSKKP
ncbi:MAG: prolyl oligopeptidase family serine peptidase [Proteobacteria bacterium]|nr:prolyl oligopeptidase family serine peptidase [Pseudomonadota bacterium]